MVSIVIPIYNGELFIEDTINSVLNQTYTDWELFIINDGSTDKSKDIIKPFLQDKRINYIYQENQGVSVARNNGLSKCKGDFIALLDADDVWLPNNLEKRVAFFKNHTDIDWIFGNIELINQKGEKINQTIEGSDSNILNDLLLWNGNIITIPSTITLKKHCIVNINYDPQFSTAADQDFVFSLASKFKGACIKEVLVQYRKVNNSMSQNIPLMEKDHIGVYTKAKQNSLFKKWSFEKKCFANLYLIIAGSWWVNGKNKTKGIYFILQSFLTYPPIILKMISKIFNA